MKLPAFALALLLPAVASADPVVVWHGYRGDEQKALEEWVQRSGIEAQFLAVPYDAFGSKLAAAIPVGRGPDVFIDGHDRLGDYLHRRLVGDPGDAAPDRKAYPEKALAAATRDGKTWITPIALKSLALYRNLALADRAPRSFEEVCAHPAPAGAFPLVYEATFVYGNAPILHAFGGELLGSDDQYRFVGPEAEAAVLFVKDLLDRGVVPKDPTSARVKDLFRSGQAAFVMSGPWFAAELGEVGFRWAVSPLPPLEKTGRPLMPFLSVEGVYLSPKGSENPDARALVRSLGSREAAVHRAKVGHAVPARRDVVIRDEPMLEAFRAQADRAVVQSSSRAMRSSFEPANLAIKKILRGDAPPSVALAEGKRRFDDVRTPLPAARSPAPFLVVVGAVLLGLAINWVRQARLRAHELRRSLPAYRWIAHAVLVVGVVVGLPLVLGTATSFFAGIGPDARFVGLANYASILGARGGALLASGSFYLVLLVTLLWTALNILFHVSIGAALGLLLHRPSLRLRGLYRVLLIVPWAVPSFVTALTWKGMFDWQYGAITALTTGLARLFHVPLEPIAWFSSFGTAFTANVLTNVWLGFPFMMVATLGALTAIPADVLEAAEVDGATRWQRLRHVVLPMLAPSMAPAVTLGTVWTFNMFNVVFLVSGGDPDGTTDILVSEAYRWAFTREAQYGYAAAYALLIFFLLAGFARVARREDGPRGGKEVWA